MKRISLLLLSISLFTLGGVLAVNTFFKNDLIMFWYDTTGGEPTFEKEGTLTFLDPTGIERGRFDVEIADTENTRELGLMFRKKMPENHGMLFIFDKEQMRAFWMKNTRIPLDILFLSADSTVVTIRAADRLFSKKPVQSSKPAKFVIELKLGTAKKLGIREGDTFQLNKN